MLKPLTPTRCLVLLACITWILVFTFVPRYDLLESSSVHQAAPRDLLPLPGAGGGDNSGGSSVGGDSESSAGGASPPAGSTPALPPSQPSPSPPSSPTPDQPPSSDTSSSTTSQSTASSAPASTSSSPPSQSSPSNTPTPTPTQDSGKPPPPSPSVSKFLSTDADGGTITIFTTLPPSSTQSSASSSASSDADQGSGGSSKSVGTSTIVGLSVAGGIAFIGIVAFVIWKLTRKRFSDDFDDNEAIKWPELNAHSDPHALPANRTGGAGFETNSEVNLTRPDSRAGSTYASSAAASAVDMYAPNPAQDPYAVPPLPHLNPNQPYRDDPEAYYDPYSGPVPQTFQEGVPHEVGPGGEAIPMTQINRARSPGPQMAYDAGRRSPGPNVGYMGDGGRNSPAPRAISPGPAMALSGRVSPGPQAAYGYGNGRQSPGPHMAYGGN